jgi:hypothetical protein
MCKLFTEHLEKQDETYLQHFCAAWKIVFCLKKIEIRCAVHAVFPFLYTDALSSRLDCLYRLTNRTKPGINEELYETYGGD